MQEVRKLKCWNCGDSQIHYLIPGDNIYECKKCGGLRRVDGTQSLGELMGLSKGKKNAKAKKGVQKP